MWYDFFLTPFGLIVLGLIGALVVVLIYLFKPRGAKKVLFMFRRKDKRVLDINVKTENDIMVTCVKRENVVRRFFKMTASWNLDGRKTLFLGVEGTVFTARPVVKGDTDVSSTETQIYKVSLADTLRGLWEKGKYEALPKELKDPIENDRIGVTIEVEPFVDDKLTPITSDQIHDQDDDMVITKLAKSSGKAKGKGEFFRDFLFGAGTGALAIIIYMIASGHLQFPGG